MKKQLVNWHSQLTGPFVNNRKLSSVALNYLLILNEVYSSLFNMIYYWFNSTFIICQNYLPQLIPNTTTKTDLVSSVIMISKECEFFCSSSYFPPRKYLNSQIIFPFCISFEHTWNNKNASTKRKWFWPITFWQNWAATILIVASVEKYINILFTLIKDTNHNSERISLCILVLIVNGILVFQNTTMTVSIVLTLFQREAKLPTVLVLLDMAFSV